MLKFVLEEVRRLQSAAGSLDMETCAAGLVLPAQPEGGGGRYVVQNLAEVPEDVYVERSAVSATLKPEYLTNLANAAKAQGGGVLLAHTHVGERTLEGFSGVDDRGEPPLAEYFARRLPGHEHFACVVTRSGVHARRLGPGAPVPVMLVGADLVQPGLQVDGAAVTFDRQVRAFGEAGQAALSNITVAVVGSGGTGSVVAQQLAYLGVNSFIFVDPDVVDETNLNRLVGAVPADVGRFKVDVAKEHVLAIRPRAQVETLRQDVTDAPTSAALMRADLAFGCTDSMASRAVLNQLAYQYYIPFIDMGVGIGASEGQVTHIAGRVQMASPSLACLVCAEKIDPEQVRRELMTQEQRENDPYITGDKVVQPAVISINSSVASAAVTMFLSAVTGIPAKARMLTFDMMRGFVRPAITEPRPHCIVCSAEGALGRGASWTLPTREPAK